MSVINVPLKRQRKVFSKQPLFHRSYRNCEAVLERETQCVQVIISLS